MNKQTIEKLQKQILAQINPNEDKLTQRIRAEMESEKPDFKQFKKELHALGAVSKVSLGMELAGLWLANITVDKAEEIEVVAEPAIKEKIDASTAVHSGCDDDDEGDEWKHQPEEKPELFEAQSFKLINNSDAATFSQFLTALFSKLLSADAESLEDLQYDLKHVIHLETPPILHLYESLPCIVITKTNNLQQLYAQEDSAIKLPAEELAAYLKDLVVGETLESVQRFCDAQIDSQNPFHHIFGQLCAPYTQMFGTTHIVPGLNDVMAFLQTQRKAPPSEAPTAAATGTDPLRAVEELGFSLDS